MFETRNAPAESRHSVEGTEFSSLSRSGFPTGAKAKRHFSHLLNQQFWLFGHDVRRADGNILLELGFEKCRPPEGSGFSSSRYLCNLDRGLTVALWGFGIYVAEHADTGIFITRSGVTPLIHTNGNLLKASWNPMESTILHKPKCHEDRQLTRQLVIKGVEWICDYEQTVIDRWGLEYRRKSLNLYKQGCCLADDLVSEWLVVSQTLEASQISRVFRD